MALGRDDWREMNALMTRAERILSPISKSLERSAVANEKLIAIAEQEQMSFEVEPVPPTCPLCGAMNPDVATHERAGSGPMAEYVVEMECSNCHFAFFGIPEGWLTTGDRNEALAIVKERAGVKNDRDGRTDPVGAGSDQGE